jgi:Zn-dependent protease with chaperone function
MTPLVPVVFNLMSNAVFSFLGALFFVWLLIWALGIGPGSGRIVLLLVPLVKVVWVLVRGIPTNSFLWAHLHGAQQDIGSFFLGFGLRPWRPPTLRMVLAAHSGRTSYPQSAGDVAYRALSLGVWHALPAILVTLALLVIAWRLALRIIGLGRFALDNRRLFENAVPLRRVKLGRVRVRVDVCPNYAGPPFAIFAPRPRIVFSEASVAALDATQRDAVICHELSHIQYCDPGLILLLQFASDVFWFLPGLGRHLERLLRDIELRADRGALERGANPESLARALLCVGESLLPAPAGSAGLLRRDRFLTTRVERLLEPPIDAGRWLYQWWFGKALLFTLVVPTILCSVFFGN